MEKPFGSVVVVICVVVVVRTVVVVFSVVFVEAVVFGAAEVASVFVCCFVVAVIAVLS